MSRTTRSSESCSRTNLASKPSGSASPCGHQRRGQVAPRLCRCRTPGLGRTALSVVLVDELAVRQRLGRWRRRGGRPSTCSRPGDTTSYTALGTARQRSPVCSLPLTCSPSLSTPPPISPCLPGRPPSLRADRGIASSSIYGRSRPMWSFRTGTTCSAPSPRRRYDRLDQTDAPSRDQPAQDTEPKRRKIPANTQFSMAVRAQPYG